MEWLLGDVYLWFERNATIIAGVELAIIITFGPGKMLLTYLMNRRIRKAAERVEHLLQKAEANDANAERRHQELVDLRSALNKLDMKPLGDSARIGRLPDGSNLVEMSNGQIRLSLPIPISAAFSGSMQGKLSVSLIKVSAVKQDKPDND